MIRFDNVTKAYPDGTVAVDRLSLEAPTGKITVLVGPSGCGKTTSMRMVNRLIEPTSGTITLGGQPVSGTDATELRRKIGYVIQHAGLFPHKNVADNVMALPRLLGLGRREARTRALELLERVGLGPQFADRYPWQLSGGQQQRVGVARALAADPPYLLMDEPFSAVDPVVRAQLQEEFLRLQREIGKTIVLVTHDIDEALKLGDQVAVLREGGRLAQAAAPAELLARPADAFVAGFVGRDRGYRALGFAGTGDGVIPAAEPAVVLGATRAEAEAAALDGWILVTAPGGEPVGWAALDRLDGDRVTEQDLNLSATTARTDGTLRELLDAALSSPSGRGVLVDAEGHLAGTVSPTAVARAIEEAASVTAPAGAIAGSAVESAAAATAGSVEPAAGSAAEAPAGSHL
ncbi:ABC transporter ATP-binding protein [Streptomyces sviceus]|uniref:ABC transporter ATP-binding protein n=1 Tax=Streptomyces sviceus TaxID=285530 RepID=UPI00332A80AC